jgi:hypothetical protein
MREEELRTYRNKAIEKDRRSIENRLNHAFNQGYEIGRQMAKSSWIFVETALPEEGVSVFVYAERNAYNDKCRFRKKVIDIGWQVDGIWHIDGCSGVVGIAWMPLPTPPNKSEIQTGAESEE